jgi:hypothetical protein
VATRYDVIIVDPLALAWPVKDENDNAEANRQMTPFVDLAHQFGAAIVLVHNAGEGNVKAKFKARGATARTDRADIVLNLDEAGSTTRRLTVAKSRFGNVNDSIEFQFAGERDYQLTKAADQPASLKAAMERRVLDAIGQLGGEVKREPGNEERLFDRALSELARGRLLKPRTGVYALPAASDGASDNFDNLPTPKVSEMSNPLDPEEQDAVLAASVIDHDAVAATEGRMTGPA